MQRGVGKHVHLSTTGFLQVQLEPHKVEQAPGLRETHQEVNVALLGGFTTSK